MTELKPCPFCGGQAGLFYGDSTEGYIKGTGYVEAFCGLCGARIRGFNRDEVVSKWNTRPNPWHTGEPIGENCFYALQRKGRIHPEPYYGVVVNGRFRAINDDGYLMPLPPDLVAYQKIKPYKETDNG